MGTAADGVSALEALERTAPDAILVDIGLPGMNGYELARAVRSRGTAHGALLVAVSGYGSPEDKAKSVEAGFDAHLVKPVDFRALSTLLASRVRGTRGRRRAATAWRPADPRHRPPASIVVSAGHVVRAHEYAATHSAITSNGAAK